MERQARTRVIVAVMVAALAVCVMPALAEKPTIPSGKTPALAKELGQLLDTKSLTNFAAPDPATPARYVSVLYTKGVQIMLIAATFAGTDIDYYLYQKDYSSAFNALRASPTTKDRISFEDIAANGLVPQPPKGMPPDKVSIDIAAHTLDGDFSDIKVINKSKISYEDYKKRFEDDDAKYAQALGVLIEALKK